MGKNMIYIFELYFDGWQHQQCNAGLISNILSAIDENVVVVATKEHIENLSSLDYYSEDRVRYIYTPSFQKKYGSADNLELKSIYKNFIIDVINDEKISNKDTLFFLSSLLAPFSAAIEINEKYQMKMFFVQHAELDDVVTMDANEYNKRNILESASENKNNYYITFSPYYFDRLKNTFTDEVLKHFVFLHHPVCGKAVRRHLSNGILIYGACSRSKDFARLLKALNAETEYISNIKIILTSPGSNGMDYKYKYPEGIHIKQKADGYTKEQFDDFFEEAGWILMPYNDKQYRISASGILSDAIRTETPIVGMNCDYLKYYNQTPNGPIGYVEENVEDCCKRIKNVVDNNDNVSYKKFITNIAKLKEMMTKENVYKLKRIILK